MLPVELASSWLPLINVTAVTLAKIQLAHIFFYSNIESTPQCCLYTTYDHKTFQFGSCPGGVSGELIELRGRKITGWFHALCLFNDGSVYSWGENRNGQLGLSHYRDVRTPWPVSHLENVTVTQIAAGAKYSLALTNEGVVYQWGQVDGTYKPQYEESYERPILLNLRNIVAISAGSMAAAAVSKDGKLYTWGWGKTGMLCRGDTENQPSQHITPVEGIDSVEKIAFGELGLLILTNGTIYTCGRTGLREGPHQKPVESIRPRPANMTKPVTNIFSNWAEQLYVAKWSGDVYKWGEAVNLTEPTKVNGTILDGFRGHQTPSLLRKDFAKFSHPMM